MLARAALPIALLAASLPAPAAAATTCSYDSNTATVSIVSDALILVLAVEEGFITYRWFGEDLSFYEPQRCGEATTTNTDTIRVSGPGTSHPFHLKVHAVREPFAPGRTQEPSGRSEIEISFDPADAGFASISTTEDSELLRLTAEGADLNADGDADVLLGAGVRSFDFTSLGGDDHIVATVGGRLGDRDSLLFNAYGWDGADRIEGGPGEDGLLGEADNDRLSGNLGNDGLVGGPGHDTLSGGPGRDLLRGEVGGDVLRGGPGADVIYGGPGRDRCLGGPGRDKIKDCEASARTRN